MNNIKNLRKNLNILKKKLKNRNLNFEVNKLNKLDELNRKIINDKEKLEQEKKSLSKSKDQSNFLKSKKISGDISILLLELLFCKSKISLVLLLRSRSFKSCLTLLALSSSLCICL